MARDDKINKSKDEPNGFYELAKYIRDSWKLGRKKVNLWVYWLVGIFGFGGIGVWASITVVCKNWTIPDVLLSLNTLAPSLVMASCLDLIFDDDVYKFMKGTVILVAFCVCTLNICSFLLKNVLWVAYLMAVVSVLLAHFIWWIINARNSKLDDGGTYEAPIGDITKEVSGESGDYDL